jgi:hypothetical protein
MFGRNGPKSDSLDRTWNFRRMGVPRWAEGLVLPKKLYMFAAVSPKDIKIPFSIEIRTPLQIVIRLRAESKTLLNQINNLHNFSFGNKNCCYNARLTNGFVLGNYF